jgi:hypothetical protein
LGLSIISSTNSRFLFLLRVATRRKFIQHAS